MEGVIPLLPLLLAEVEAEEEVEVEFLTAIVLLALHLLLSRESIVA